MAKMRNKYKVLVEITEGKRSLGRLGIDWIKILKWILMVQDRVHWLL